MDNKKLALIFKALCDENRVAIVKILQSGEKCACHIGDALGLAQSKLSYHMKILCASGIIECWYVGKWTHYRINKQGAEFAVLAMQQLTTTDCGVADTAEKIAGDCGCQQRSAIIN